MIFLSALSLSICPTLSTSSFLNSPRNIKVSNSSDPTLVNIFWSPPEEPNGKITGYDILYTDNNSLIDRKWKRKKVIGKKTTIALNELIPDSKYFLKIKARIDEKELGASSDVIEFITKPPHKGLFELYILICFLLIVFVFLYFFFERKQNKEDKKRTKKNNKNTTREGLTI